MTLLIHIFWSQKNQQAATLSLEYGLSTKNIFLSGIPELAGSQTPTSLVNVRANRCPKKQTMISSPLCACNMRASQFNYLT